MKKLHVLTMAVALAAAVILPVGVANADSPIQQVSGSFQMVFTGMGSLDIVGNDGVWLGRDWPQMATYFDGDIEGSGTELADFRWNAHSLQFNSIGTSDFAGTILGRSGTYTSRVVRQGYSNMADDGLARQEETILSGTGELANLHGTLHFTVTLVAGGWAGTYSGEVHFAP